MPASAQLANIVIGQEPPPDPTPVTRWISTSTRHLQVPQTPYERIPIIGTFVGNAASTQECSPWYNTTLQRYECIVNTGANQYFWYADNPLGPWSGGTKVLGGGVGGEAGNVQQCSVYVEGTTIYAVYLKSSTATVVTMAHATMPTTASATPSFTVDGTIYDNGGVQIQDSSWLMKVGTAYYLFTYSLAAQRIALTTATAPSGFVAAPFSAVTTQLRGIYFSMGNRTFSRIGRIQVFYENGTWIAFGHILDGLDFGTSQVYRFTCNDPGTYPVTWVSDPVQRPYLEQLHPAEIDQIADFRLLQGANDRWYAFWSGNDNAVSKFNIMAAPAREPMLAYDGFDWQYTQVLANSGYGPGYINPDASAQDIITGQTPAAIGHMWDVFFRTQSGSLKGTLPPAAAHAKCKLTNAPTDVTSFNLVHFVPYQSSDKIDGGNHVVSFTRAATVVTVTTKWPHNLTTDDAVTVTGCTPSGYNISGTPVTGVPTSTTFTYSVASDPGANTVVGAWIRSLRPGESQPMKCRIQGIWVRD